MLHLFAGCLNRKAPYFAQANGVGLSVYRLDEETLAAELLDSAGDIDNPTFLSVDAGTGCIYANSEVFGWKEGVVSAYHFDARAGRLTYLNKQVALGSITAHNAISRDGRHLLVANYGMGEGGPDQALVVFPIHGDGSLGPAAGSAAQAGTLGPNGQRQERNHAHCVAEFDDGLVAVTDLGLDRIFTYAIGRDGAVQRRGETALPPGAGPRHLTRHPDGRHAFVFNELDSTICALRLGSGGQFEVRDSVPALPRGVEHSHGADIHVSPDGRFVYGSNRGHDSIAVFGFEAVSGRLTPLGHTSCGGRTPRNFAITPSGRHLAVANQDSDTIVFLSRNEATGALTDTGKRLDIGTPMCVRITGA